MFLRDNRNRTRDSSINLTMAYASIRRRISPGGRVTDERCDSATDAALPGSMPRTPPATTSPAWPYRRLAPITLSRTARR